MGIYGIARLNSFFDPTVIEKLIINSDALDGNGENDNNDGEAWFNQQNRIECATLALQSLCGALEIENPKHQKLIALNTDVVISAAFWLARKGPEQLVKAALILLSRIVQNNPDVACQVADMIVVVTASKSGRTHPFGTETPLLYFGWRPLPSDERRIVTVPALLAERYIYSSTTWNVPSLMTTSTVSTADGDVAHGAITDPGGLSVPCLHVLETLLRADSTTCDLMIQYILAPPPPSAMDDENLNSSDMTALETMKPLALILLNSLLEGSNRVLSTANLPMNIMKSEINVVERSANVLALLFINGGQTARELSTVISTSHTSISGNRERKKE